jgi:hypothetical protein
MCDDAMASFIKAIGEAIRWQEIYAEIGGAHADEMVEKSIERANEAFKNLTGPVMDEKSKPLDEFEDALADYAKACYYAEIATRMDDTRQRLRDLYASSKSSMFFSEEQRKTVSDAIEILERSEIAQERFVADDLRDILAKSIGASHV